MRMTLSMKRKTLCLAAAYAAAAISCLEWCILCHSMLIGTMKNANGNYRRLFLDPLLSNTSIDYFMSILLFFLCRNLFSMELVFVCLFGVFSEIVQVQKRNLVTHSIFCLSCFDFFLFSLSYFSVFVPCSTANARFYTNARFNANRKYTKYRDLYIALALCACCFVSFLSHIICKHISLR